MVPKVPKPCDPLWGLSIVFTGLEHCSFMNARLKHFIALLYFQIEAFYVAQVSLELSILLPHFPSPRDYRCSLVDF